ncbi:23S rRNA (cytosine1962-C5)-methyltransferase [Deinobacterium chartae]|uniref:23S rRNA (Cytosine1962-C5)-methyltransferase n=1 Tax=Deinobacterium chartae TaxID=521158 RepID=A0A841HTE2_9DEIO|nr:23S rRNA (cytosine(2499)-C(5))-methyltransferase [Deinobacterium chartae]MBB6096681.1 23S rRNA (cytosine1962-C5)-methyltransferase [Deinobacterium chartae]
MNSLSSSRSQARLRLRVRPAAESHLRHGHPWLYEGSIREQNRPGESGELAVVFDRQDRFLAIGLYDPDSPIRLRVLHVGKPQNIDAAWWAEHLETALARRAGLFGEDTDGYRLINGESDRWPGLVLDRYADTLVLKLYTAAWFAHWDTLTDLFASRFPDMRLVLRLSRNIQPAAAARGLHDGDVLRGTAPQGPVVFRESGLRFEADVIRGQKTGFFLDQRENRRQIEQLARGRRVLNAFSFSGGFSLYAARGGARSVVSLDISAHALASAERNFALNADPDVASCTHRSVQADVFEWLTTSRDRFDLIILDPPSLAKRESERAQAVRAYARLAADALRLLEPGGVLLCASCSAHVSDEEFFAAVREVAQRSGRSFKELRTAHHAPDHPASFAEARYLKAIYLQF